MPLWVKISVDFSYLSGIFVFYMNNIWPFKNEEYKNYGYFPLKKCLIHTVLFDNIEIKALVIRFSGPIK